MARDKLAAIWNRVVVVCKPTGNKLAGLTGVLLVVGGVVLLSGNHAGDNRAAHTAKNAVLQYSQTKTGRRVNVSTADELASAMAQAKPGDSIALADATYDGDFNSTVSGTADQPISLTGSSRAVIKGGSGYALSLGKPESDNSVSYWRITGLTVSGGKKGIMFDHVEHSIIDGVTVQGTAEEGIHLRNFSSNDVIRHSTVSRTGLKNQGYGEGIYVGSAISNWSDASGGRPDNSNDNVIDGNTISQTGAENIDIKEGTHGGTISNNHFDGSSMCPEASEDCNSADSFIDMKGQGWLVTDNDGQHMHADWQDGTPENDGFQVHAIKGAESESSGSDNSFRANRFSDLGGYGINIAERANGNAVACDNRVNGAKGLSDQACRQ